MARIPIGALATVAAIDRAPGDGVGLSSFAGAMMALLTNLAPSPFGWPMGAGADGSDAAELKSDLS